MIIFCRKLISIDIFRDHNDTVSHITVLSPAAFQFVCCTSRVIQIACSEQHKWFLDPKQVNIGCSAYPQC